MICYTIPNTNIDFYFDPHKVTKMLFQPDGLTIRIKLEGDKDYETLIFPTDEEYFSFKQYLMGKVV